jgi:hypothetical protein
MSPTEPNPELPDPLRPSRETMRETLVERQIREAMEEGAFDDLPHRGRPLPLEDDAAAGAWAMAHRMLKNAGAAPPWIESDKEVRALLARRDDRLAQASLVSPLSRPRVRAEFADLILALNRAIARVNAEAPTDRQHRRPLDPAVEMARLDAAFGGGVATGD